MKGTKNTRWMRRLRGVWQCFPNIGLRFGPKRGSARRVRVLCKLVIFLVLTGISEIFTVRAPNWHSHDKQEKQAKKDYYDASDSVLEIGYLLGSNGVSGEFHRKSSRGWLWWKAPKSMVKTKIQRRVFCKLVIVYFVMGFKKNFRVRVPKRRFDEIHQKNRWIRLFCGVWQYFANWSSFWS